MSCLRRCSAFLLITAMTTSAMRVGDEPPGEQAATDYDYGGMASFARAVSAQADVLRSVNDRVGGLVQASSDPAAAAGDAEDDKDDDDDDGDDENAAAGGTGTAGDGKAADEKEAAEEEEGSEGQPILHPSKEAEGGEGQPILHPPKAPKPPGSDGTSKMTMPSMTDNPTDFDVPKADEDAGEAELEEAADEDAGEEAKEEAKEAEGGDDDDDESEKDEDDGDDDEASEETDSLLALSPASDAISDAVSSAMEYTDGNLDAIVKAAVKAVVGQSAAAKSPENPSVADFPFEAVEPEDIKKTAKAQMKPAMILVTKTVCPTCQDLYASMSASPTIKELMQKFVTVHLGEGKTWKVDRGFTESYVPRVYFMSVDGHPLDFFANRADHPKYSYSFTQADDLERVMKVVLGLPTDAGKENDPFQKQDVKGNDCKDVSDECQMWAIMGQCTLNFANMRQICLKSCGMCTA